VGLSLAFVLVIISNKFLVLLILKRIKSNEWQVEQTKTLLFVQKYREQECLWNLKCSLYKNRVERKKAYRRLLEAMDDPEITVYDAKMKIKSLRTTFHQEKRR
jgi:hypothetical protein